MIEDVEPRNRMERRLWGRRFVRCDKCFTRYRLLNDEQHTDRCRGYVNRPKKKRTTRKKW